MPKTYEPIATATGTGSSGTITFSGIPSTYTDLILITSGNCGSDFYTVRVNNDSGSNYSRTLLYYANSGGVISSRNSNSTSVFGTIGNSSSNIGGTIHHFMNYANTTTNKTIIRRGGVGNVDGSPQAEVGLWRSTVAIDRIDLGAGSGNFSTGTIVTLYGIKAA
jgi:hypothetical protein